MPINWILGHKPQHACKKVSTDREAIEMLSRENPEMSMDRGSIENLLGPIESSKIFLNGSRSCRGSVESKQRGSIEMDVSRYLSRSYQA